MKRLFWLCNIVIPLSAGLLLYVALRPDTHLAQGASQIFPTLSGPGGPLPIPPGAVRFFRGHAGDMLWAYALTTAAGFVLRGAKGDLLGAALVGISLGSLLELGQALHLMSGTPDLWDVVLEAISCIFAVYRIKKYRGGTEYERKA